MNDLDRLGCKLGADSQTLLFGLDRACSIHLALDTGLELVAAIRTTLHTQKNSISSLAPKLVTIHRFFCLKNCYFPYSRCFVRCNCFRTCHSPGICRSTAQNNGPHQCCDTGRRRTRIHRAPNTSRHFARRVHNTFQ